MYVCVYQCINQSMAISSNSIKLEGMDLTKNKKQKFWKFKSTHTFMNRFEILQILKMRSEKKEEKIHRQFSFC